MSAFINRLILKYKSSSILYNFFATTKKENAWGPGVTKTAQTIHHPLLPYAYK
ncbi:MAG TPA: hypothetical protein PKK61_01280 [Defluviitaleaceae bacterium]|nr:hypothetical protein [Defluviitaleaceae bacterium]